MIGPIWCIGPTPGAGDADGYEVVTFQALREQLRCKEIWVVGAESWRNPDQDLPADFEERRVENYRELRKPVDLPRSSTACVVR